MDIPNELLISTKKDSIGMAILKNLKGGANNSNASRIIGARPPEKKPDFDSMVLFLDFFWYLYLIKKQINYKDDYLGVGAENTGEFEENDWFSEQLTAILKSNKKTENQGENEDSQKNNNIIKFTGFQENTEQEEDCI